MCGSGRGHFSSDMEPVKIVFDIGGTMTRVGKIADGELSQVERFRTPADSDEGLAAIITTTEHFAKDFPIGAACGGISGVVKDGVALRVPHLPLWSGTAVAERLRLAFDAPVTLFNDAELVALGEYYFGAGKGEKNMLYVTVSTGVGGAHVVNGRIEKGKYNLELGHQNVDGAELEELVSGSAIEKKYGIHPKELSDKNTLNELADTLATGLYDSVLHLSPEAIILGGAMITGKNPIPLARVEKTLVQLVEKYYPEAPRIKKAMLGDDGGLYGGMAYLRQD